MSRRSQIAAATPRERIAHWGRVVLVNLAILTALLALVELVMGTWIFGPNLGSLNIHTNVQFAITGSPYYPPGTVAHYRRDRYGLRGDYGGDPARITLLTVGGSTTAEVTVGEGDTWSDALARGLRGQGKSVTIANAGVDGHSTVGHIKSFDAWFAKIPGLRPRYIVFLVGVNDRGVAPDAVSGPDSLVNDTAYKRARAFVENNSAIVRLARTLRGWIAARRIGVHHGSGGRETEDSKWVPAPLPADLAERLHASVEAYGRRLRVLHARALAFGATPIYVTQINGDGRIIGGVVHEIEGSGGGRIFAELALYNAELLRFCAEVRAHCADLAAELKFGPGDFYDAVHTTPQGSRKIGEYLAGKLKDIVK
jgi:lysophospholipase L1-like esterase